MAVLYKSPVVRGDIQRRQHFQHGGILLHVLLAVPEKATAVQLLHREIAYRLFYGGPDLRTALVRRQRLRGLCRQQDVVEPVRLGSHALLLQLSGPLRGITELAAALLTGQRLGQKLLPQRVERLRSARIACRVQIQQHIQPVLVRLHHLRPPQRLQQVVTGEIRHVQPHGRHRAERAGDIGVPAPLLRQRQPVCQRLQILVVEALRHVGAGGPQRVHRLGVGFLPCGG